MATNEPERFTLTETHVTLLRASYTRYEDYVEFGAAAIDSKRPYGNSDVYGDLAELLGIEEGDDFSDEQRARMLAVHKETARALQVVLRAGTFEPGEYVADKYRENWRAADTGDDDG